MTGSTHTIHSISRKTSLRKREKREFWMKQVAHFETLVAVLDCASLGNLKRPKMFFKALEETNLWLAAKKSNRKNGRLSSAVASRAASLAAAENKKPRCRTPP